MVSGISGSVNALLAAQSPLGRQAVSNEIQNARAFQSEGKKLQLQAQSIAVKAGPGAQIQTKYDYAVGPDGQLYIAGVTVSTTRRVQGQLSSIDPDGKNQQSNSPFRQALDRQPKSFSEILNPKAQLSPSDEVVLFSADDFRAQAFGSVDNLNHARLQVTDFGVRAQEAQHFRVGGGATSLPEYDYEVGPNGELYAVAGSVDIDPGSAATPEEAARDAQTVAAAALAATDVSAQDVSVARSAQSSAAQFVAQARQQQRIADLYKQNNDIVFNNSPLLDAAA